MFDDMKVKAIMMVKALMVKGADKFLKMGSGKKQNALDIASSNS
jgi:uncharacterized Zn ribbon protein